MARFTFFDYDSDDSSVESGGVQPVTTASSNDGSCSLPSTLSFFLHPQFELMGGNYCSSDDETVGSVASVESAAPSDEPSLFYESSDEDEYFDKYSFSSDDETVASRELSIEDSILGVDFVDDGESDDEDPVPSPPVVAAIVDVVPPRRSSRSRRKPVRFADEYAKFY